MYRVRILKVGSHKECLEPFLRTGNHRCVVTEQQATDNGYKHDREEVCFATFFCIIHDNIRLGGLIKVVR